MSLDLTQEKGAILTFWHGAKSLPWLALDDFSAELTLLNLLTDPIDHYRILDDPLDANVLKGGPALEGL